MDLQDLGYALAQVAHNFGAVTVTAGAVLGGRLAPRFAPHIQRRTAWVVLGGWAVQAISGATFGTISYLTMGQLPDIHGIAVAALALKMTCAAGGLVLCAVYLARSGGWNEAARRRSWRALTAFGVTALTAAAFLRWFS